MDAEKSEGSANPFGDVISKIKKVHGILDRVGLDITNIKSKVRNHQRSRSCATPEKSRHDEEDDKNQRSSRAGFSRQGRVSQIPVPFGRLRHRQRSSPNLSDGRKLDASASGEGDLFVERHLISAAKRADPPSDTGACSEPDTTQMPLRTRYRCGSGPVPKQRTKIDKGRTRCSASQRPSSIPRPLSGRAPTLPANMERRRNRSGSPSGLRMENKVIRPMNRQHGLFPSPVVAKDPLHKDELKSTLTDSSSSGEDSETPTNSPRIPPLETIDNAKAAETRLELYLSNKFRDEIRSLEYMKSHTRLSSPPRRILLAKRNRTRTQSEARDLTNGIRPVQSPSEALQRETQPEAMDLPNVILPLPVHSPSGGLQKSVYCDQQVVESEAGSIANAGTTDDPPYPSKEFEQDTTHSQYRNACCVDPSRDLTKSCLSDEKIGLDVIARSSGPANFPNTLGSLSAQDCSFENTNLCSGFVLDDNSPGESVSFWMNGDDAVHDNESESAKSEVPTSSESSTTQEDMDSMTKEDSGSTSGYNADAASRDTTVGGEDAGKSESYSELDHVDLKICIPASYDAGERQDFDERSESLFNSGGETERSVVKERLRQYSQEASRSNSSSPEKSLASPMSQQKIRRRVHQYEELIFNDSQPSCRPVPSLYSDIEKMLNGFVIDACMSLNNEWKKPDSFSPTKGTSSFLPPLDLGSLQERKVENYAVNSPSQTSNKDESPRFKFPIRIIRRCISFLPSRRINRDYKGKCERMKHQCIAKVRSLWVDSAVTRSRAGRVTLSILWKLFHAITSLCLLILLLSFAISKPDKDDLAHSSETFLNDIITFERVGPSNCVV